MDLFWTCFLFIFKTNIQTIGIAITLVVIDYILNTQVYIFIARPSVYKTRSRLNLFIAGEVSLCTQERNKIYVDQVAQSGH